MSRATHPVAATFATLVVVLVCRLALALYPPATHARVLINEIMADPGSGEPEWIELYNDADTAVNLDRWIFHDRTAARPELPAITIAAGGYLVLAKDTADLLATRDVAGPLIHLSFAALNNSGDDLVLRDATGTVVDSVPYRRSWGGDDGISLERIDPDGSSIDPSNWGTSTDPSGATPGARNSLTVVVERNLVIVSFTFDPTVAMFRAVLRNDGTKTSIGAVLSLFHDINEDGRGLPDESLAGRPIDPIVPEDSTVVDFRWLRPLTIDGEIALIELDHTGDEVPSDNTTSIRVAAPRADTGVVISEFLYDPDDGLPEYVELYNRGEHPVDLGGWIVHDAGQSRPEIAAVTLAPSAYVVLTTDTARLRDGFSIPSDVVRTSLPSLNNSGDLLVLRNRAGAAVDSLRYDDAWGGRDGRSLERVDPFARSETPASWSSSRDEAGGTPGRENSNGRPTFNIALLDATFSYGDRTITLRALQTGRERIEDATISLEQQMLPMPGTFDTVSLLFDWDEPIGPNGRDVLFRVHSRDDELPEDDTLRLTLRRPTLDTGAILNELMIDPREDEPEWVEVLNRTDLPIVLTGWHLADATGESLPFPNITLEPESLLVFTTDATSVAEIFGTDPIKIIEIPLPSFNNGGDDIRLVNSSGTIVDELRYDRTWADYDGRSLERVDPGTPSSVRATWRTSPDPRGGTPGSPNAWRPILVDLSLDDPLYLPGSSGSSDSVAVRLRNRGTGHPGIDGVPTTVTIRLAVDLDNNGTVDATELIEESVAAMPDSGETDRIAFAWRRQITLDGETALIEAASSAEERPEDNLVSIRIARSGAAHGIVINEIMYDPSGDEPEWVELLNVLDESVRLTDWVLHDAGAARPMLTNADLAPGDYLLLTGDTAALRASRTILSDATLMQIDLPTLNNGGDLVALRNRTGAVVDSVRYRPEQGGTDGGSLERRDPLRASSEPGNWSGSIDGAGATPGWSNSILPASIDLAVIDARPVITGDGESSEIVVTLRNVGRTGSDTATLDLFFDANDDGIGHDTEREISWRVGPLAVDETVVLRLPWHRSLDPEGEPGLVRITVTGDERPENDALPFRIGALLGRSGLILNEIMPAPEGSEPEWVELFNATERPIDLDGWQIGDEATATMITEHLLVPPGGFAILTSDPELLYAARPIPATTAMAELAIPTLNNGGDLVRLIDPDEVTVDSVRFDEVATSDRGRSFERRHPDLAADDPRSWRVADTAAPASPGNTNSALLPDVDGVIKRMTFDPINQVIAVIIGNGGVRPIAAAEIALGWIDEEGTTQSISHLELDDTLRLLYRLDAPLAIEQRTFVARLILAEDEHPTNNSDSLIVRREPPTDGLIITEIMADPLPVGGDPGAEYIEIYNLNDRAVPLGGWQIEDGSGSPVVVPDTEEERWSVPSGSFTVIASDTLLFARFPTLRSQGVVAIVGEDLGLNNSGDTITLRNRQDEAIDAVRYDDRMHDPEIVDRRGTALERLVFDRPALDTTDWASSVARLGGTPGAENSRRIAGHAGNTLLTLGSPSVSPDGDGFEDFVRISWQLSETALPLSITIVDRSGHIVARPLSNRRVPAEGDIVWDGTDDSGLPLPIGPYFVRLTAGDHTAMAIIIVAALR